MRRSFVAAILAVLLVALGACKDGEAPVAKPPSALPAGSTVTEGIILSRDNRLVLRSPSNGTEQTIKQVPRPSLYTFPRWSPDGKQIAYVIETAATGSPGAGGDYGSDFALSEPNGSNERIIFRRETPGTFVLGLAWARDGASLYAGIQEPVTQNGRVVDITTRLDRIDVASGARTTVIDEAKFPAIAPDGARIAYLTDGSVNEPGGLWTANIDGTDPQLIVPYSDRIVQMLYPRYAPDGKRIAYAAVTRGSAAEPSPARPRTVRWPWEPRTAAAHGFPMDVWVVASQGGTPERLTSLFADEPTPAWSPDGTKLAIFATGGLYELALGGEPRQIGLGAFGGQLDWR